MQLELGTADFKSPELYNREIYNEKVDIWSIGVITYMLLTGKRLFPAKDNNHLKKLVRKADINFSEGKFIMMSNEAVNFLKKALEKDPMYRASAKELLDHSFLKT